MEDFVGAGDKKKGTRTLLFLFDMNVCVFVCVCACEMIQHTLIIYFIFQTTFEKSFLTFCNNQKTVGV